MTSAVGSLGILISTPLGDAFLRHGGWIALEVSGGGTFSLSTVSVFASRSRAGWRFTREPYFPFPCFVDS